MIIFLWVKGFCMNKGFLALALFGISLFLLVSSVSAEDIGSDDSNANIEVIDEGQSIETSDISSDSANSERMLATMQALILQKFLLSFHPLKILVQLMEKKPNSL